MKSNATTTPNHETDTFSFSFFFLSNVFFIELFWTVITRLSISLLDYSLCNFVHVNLSAYPLNAWKLYVYLLPVVGFPSETFRYQCDLVSFAANFGNDKEFFITVPCVNYKGFYSRMHTILNEPYLSCFSFFKVRQGHTKDTRLKLRSPSNSLLFKSKVRKYPV